MFKYLEAKMVSAGATLYNAQLKSINHLFFWDFWWELPETLYIPRFTATQNTMFTPAPAVNLNWSMN